MKRIQNNSKERAMYVNNETESWLQCYCNDKYRCGYYGARRLYTLRKSRDYVEICEKLQYA
ncbi:hypothetical protein F441_03664 [Phytophthora nicotianae CJ01A1]|uniref:Uncharacterized protein n=4 Tax=Phytophthora nicotianae TaxID=4792 RepID=W2QMV3_PHYN3|nr:hypothetical protein PPTG_08515 [Phytophthora nicotianae INRA-310]ETK93193.1 hypothetical protein L915_03565 [Phytophthora nicotianae]ETO82031.1 hypothetical protein F444_03735 [Phytophthora nicotianae P1976]ETP23134.1 hypothetical protein F441_03664 [Phytophthora nicotianae CJ01A1]ETL46608.1 hypothetical protein L916_03513 [Phytophthora nicotianae]ETM52897.1 hypothetical protein L914_03538 [Phytophthora nicotianae]